MIQKQLQDSAPCENCLKTIIDLKLNVLFLVQKTIHL